jgi:hypothetical protein
MLWLILFLGCTTQAYITDNTDCNQDVIIHTLPYALSRDSGTSPIRVHYELGGLDLEPHLKDYFVDVMMKSSLSYLSKAISVNAI